MKLFYQFFRAKKMFLLDIWFLVIEYLSPMDLFSLSLCYQDLYVVAHKNKKYRKTFDHSKQILSYKSVSRETYAASKELLLKLSSLFGFSLCKENFDWVKKRFSADVIERILFFCERGTISTCNLCVSAVIWDKNVYHLLRSKLFVHKNIFQVGFSDTFLADRISLFVCQRRSTDPDLFDAFYAFYTQEIIENSWFLLRRYLEILCRVFFNSIQHETFPRLRWIFNQNKPSAANESNLALVFYSMSIDLRKEIVKVLCFVCWFL